MFGLLGQHVEQILTVLKMPVTQQRLHLPEKLRALKKTLVSNGMKDKFVEFIQEIGVQQHQNEEAGNDDLLLNTANIDRMVTVL